MECDGFFFDSTSQKIRFVAGYVKDGTEKDMVLQEMEISLSDQSISSKTILDTAGTADFVRDAIRGRGKFVSYDIFRGDSIYFYARDSGGEFSEVARFLATSPCSTFTLWCNHVKHLYQRIDNVNTGTTQLMWLKPDTCQFEETSFKSEFCSLFTKDDVFIVDPENPKNILGQLCWDKGIIRPQWSCGATQAFFTKAESAIRARLKEDGRLFRDVEFDYQRLQVGLIGAVRTIQGALQGVGFDDAGVSFL